MSLVSGTQLTGIGIRLHSVVTTRYKTAGSGRRLVWLPGRGSGLGGGLAPVSATLGGRLVPAVQSD